MPIQPTYPGVYIQEVSSGVRTITGVATSTAAFFGRALKGPVDIAVRCTSFTDFLRNFGVVPHPKSDLKNSVKQFFDNGGSDCYVVRVAKGAVKAEAEVPNGVTPTAQNILLFKAKTEGVWGNNIQLEVAMTPTVDAIPATTTDPAVPAVNPDGLFDLTVSEMQGTTALVSETYLNLSMNPASPRYVVNLVTQNSALVDVKYIGTTAITTFNSKAGPQSTTTTTGTGTATVVTVTPIKLQTGLDEAAVTPATDPTIDAAAYQGLESSHTGFFALDKVDLFNLMIIPGDVDINDTNYKDIINSGSIYCMKHRAFLLADSPSIWTTGRQLNTGTTGPADTIDDFRIGLEKQYSAVFYPRLVFSDAGIVRSIGASGAIAGVMARTDSQRGVWKAPAGVDADIRGILDLDVNLTDNENGILNKQGINCLRKFPNGIVNWGARTLDGADDFGSEWKYIPIRRLALFLEESLFRGTKWVVFEPNDEPLWAQIRMNLNAFMTSLFRQGAFQGSTPDKAFFVKCDGETTTQNDRNLGIVNIQVGFAPLKPAEFVIITIQQIAGDLV
jgi:phage tail sheath protein FI